MTIFNKYIKRVAVYVGEMREKGRQVREIDCPVDFNRLVEGLPIQVRPQAGSGLVLRGDTFVELGNPSTGSCAFVLCTDNPSLVRNGRITLIGSDIQEMPAASQPFGQILIVGGKRLHDDNHQALSQNQYISDQIEGYMVRSSSERIWSRVSKDTAKKGFCFEILGRALMSIYRSQVPEVQTMEVIFVTSSKEDLRQLDNIAIQVKKIGDDIARQKWKSKGFDIVECTLGWNCSSCKDKPVCDNVRELITVRKKRSRKPKSSSNHSSSRVSDTNNL